MTRAELAAALRERFSTLRADVHPELVALMQRIPDDQVIESHIRCGACRRFHTTVAEAVKRAEAFPDIIAYFDAMQAHVVRQWPRACLKRLDDIERALQGTRPS